jgi:PTS system mannose-specific IIA component
MIKLIVLTHGNLGEELYKTVEMIMGKQEESFVFSSGNLGPSDLYKNVEHVVSKSSSKEYGVVIAVDLKGGNTWNIACKLSHHNGHVHVISGVNLGILISFFTKRQNYDIHKLMDVLVEDGHRHIVQFCS